MVPRDHHRPAPRFHQPMPVYDSLAFVNNRGGSGKSFLVSQLAAQTALSHPDKKVLIVDFSLYSDNSVIYMGGTVRDTPISQSRGRVNTVNHTTADTRACGMIRDLLTSIAEPEVPEPAEVPRPTSRGLFGNLFGAWFVRPAQPVVADADMAEPPVDIMKYATHVNPINPLIPENVYLVASAGSVDWGSQNTGRDGDGSAEIPFWARRTDDDWWPLAKALKEALERLDGEWIVIFDTDHLAASPLTKLALGTAKGSVIPASINEADLQRLFEDDAEQALFTNVMVPMQNAGQLGGPLRHVIITRVVSNGNQESETPNGIPSPCKMATATAKACDFVLETFREMANSHDTEAPIANESTLTSYSKTLKKIFVGDGDDDIAVARLFAQKAFTTFKAIPDTIANTTSRFGAPFAIMTGQEDFAQAANVSKPVLEAVQHDIKFVADRILPPTS